MRRKANITRFLAAAVIAAAIFGGCKKTEAPSTAAAADDRSEHHVITCSSTFFIETGVDYMDAVAKELVKDLNITLEFIPIPLNGAAERCRIWISSGDMPDITSYGFSIGDYTQYVEQDLVRALPDDYETRYPSLAKAIAASELDVPLKERFGGKMYAAPRPIFVNDLIERPMAEHSTLYYRKDWCEQLGLPVKTTFSLTEVMTMAKAFMEQDPNNNGPGKTVGFAVEPARMISTFVLPFNKYYGNGGAAYKDPSTGKYEYSPFQQGTLTGLELLRGYYDEKIIYPDFFTIRARGEVEAMLNAGLTGLMINGGAFGNVKRIFGAFEAATKLPVMDTLEIADVTNDDYIPRSQVFMNHQAMNYFSPKMSENKFQRTLAFLDWAATDDMQNMINLGIPGKDWTQNGDVITITRPKTPSGDFVPMGTYYPSYNILSIIVIAWDDFTARDPSANQALLDKNKALWNNRSRNGDLFLTDYDLTFYTSPARDRLATINANTELTNVVMKGPNVRQNFEAFVTQFTPIVKEALDDINKNVGSQQ